MNGSNSNSNGSFFDARTLAAVIMIGVFWIAWQSYLATKYPHQESETSGSVKTKMENGTEVKNQTDPIKIQPESQSRPHLGAFVEPESVAEQIEVFEDETYKIEVSSRGLGLKRVELKGFQDRSGQNVVLGKGEDNYAFETRWGDGTPVFFDIKKDGGQFRGVAQKDGIQIEKSFEVLPATFAIRGQITWKGERGKLPPVVNYLSEAMPKPAHSSFFAPSLEKNEFFVAWGGTSERTTLTNDHVQDFPQADVVALGSHYFSLVFLDRSPVAPQVHTNFSQGEEFGRASIRYVPPSDSEDFSVLFSGFIGPKFQRVLEGLDSRLTGLVNFGMFGWIARPLLELLRWFYSIFENWGLAIIMLTLLVRLVVLPFNLMAYRSMKVMQAIQPEIKALREKFEGDPQRLNQEMMELMKRNKANPIGGCLPMLLQLPIFFALYQVFNQSVELYRAPFFLWIQDLSLKDPYFVIPVLMGIAMFVQQKITPTSMDPAQAKILQWLPVVFTLFMVSLPSGLTLYILVSTVFGIFQQTYFMRQKGPVQLATQG